MTSLVDIRNLNIRFTGERTVHAVNDLSLSLPASANTFAAMLTQTPWKATSQFSSVASLAFIIRLAKRT